MIRSVSQVVEYPVEVVVNARVDAGETLGTADPRAEANDTVLHVTALVVVHSGGLKWTA